MAAERHKCYTIVFSPSIHWDNYRGGSRAAATSKMKCFVIIVNGFTSERKRFFFKITWQMLSKLTKSMRNCQHPILWRHHQNKNLSFRNFLLKYELRIKDKENNFHLNFFQKFLTKRNSWRSCKISRRDKY